MVIFLDISGRLKMVKFIELPNTDGLVFLIDDEDYEDVIRFNWHYGGGYVRRNKLKDEPHERKEIHVEQQIFNGNDIIKKGRSNIIDHINNMFFDNRRKNIRTVTHGQNVVNIPRNINNVSGYIGVYFHKKMNKWVVSVGSKYSGAYENIEDAGKRRDELAVQKYGDCARLNFPILRDLDEMSLEELIVQLRNSEDADVIIDEIKSRDTLYREDLEISAAFASNLHILLEKEINFYDSHFKIEFLQNVRELLDGDFHLSEVYSVRKTSLMELGGRRGKGFAFLIDFCDFERINQFKWTIDGGYDVVRSTHKDDLHETNFIPLSWQILIGTECRKKNDVAVDEINKNNLDGRKINLRLVDSVGQSGGGKKRVTNQSGFIGVCFRKSNSKYQANITINGKSKYLGCWPTKEEAARFRDAKAIELFGENAILNFPPEKEDPRKTYNLEDLVSELIICQEDQIEGIFDEISSRESYHLLEIENSKELLDKYVHLREERLEEFKIEKNYRQNRKINKYLKNIE
jgi:hypothetical protein